MSQADSPKIIFATLVVGNFLPKNIIEINYFLIIIGLIISFILIVLGTAILKGVDNK